MILRGIMRWPLGGTGQSLLLLFLFFLSLSVEAESSASTQTQKTLVVYSGPTSMDRHEGKNGMYHDNMVYFLEHGISCFDNDAGSKVDNNAEGVIVNYVFVLTQEVAGHYSGPDGALTKKIQECERVNKDAGSSFIRVMTRLDRCYDMESIYIVANSDMLDQYDNILFMNCGMVGPKLGPGSPKLIPASSKNATRAMVPFSHWSQLYTSRLTDSIKLVGHSINTQCHGLGFSPHVQSFLYAVRTETVKLLLSSGAIYDCGLTQEELGGNEEVVFELIKRYEVGMSTQLLTRGYKVSTAFINQFEFGTPLIYDTGVTLGKELDYKISDIWFEDGIRQLTGTMPRQNHKFWETNDTKSSKESFAYHQFDILPWDYFVFFKVSRLVPSDVQAEMKYNADELEKNDISVVPNDARNSSSKYWWVKVYTKRNAHLYAWRISALCGLGLFFAQRRWLIRIICSRFNNLMRRKKHAYNQ